MMKESETQAKIVGENGFGEEDFQKVAQIVVANKGKAGDIIRILQQAQGLFGYLPVPIIEKISQLTKISKSEIYGIISFYSFFTMVPKGKYVIQVCMGTSCYVRGGEKILNHLKKEWKLEPGSITSDGRFSLQEVRCLGCCGLSPVIAINEHVHRRVKPNQMKEILNSYR
ncbi:MAG: NAD(P)H-dependent oxidoreductase subunit E [Dehalococcoidales bacterium]|nr:NAD(P)H-dependent oxidoreductase subunit E [Dehalococcoidales bacterium]